MHTTHRFRLMTVSLLILVPILSFSAHVSFHGSLLALNEVDERFQKSEEIRKAAQSVQGADAAKANAKAVAAESKEVMSESEAEMQKLAREKRELRLQLAEVLKHEEELIEKGIDPEDTAAIMQLLEQEKGRMNHFLRSAHVAYASQTTDTIGSLLGQTLTSSTLGERTEEAIRTRAILNAREKLLSMLRRAQGLPSAIDSMRAEHEELLSQYHDVLHQHEEAGERLHRSAVNQDAIKRTVAEVNHQIVQMQNELARIDARLRRTAERALIEKGLLSPKVGEYSGGKIVGQAADLSWPARGRISAGFYLQSYYDYFGVHHKGIDIVIPQGSPVYAAADGIVYLARNGGATGYSYILMGHQGGRATLYGHMSRFAVATGQAVHRGQVIGYSGGNPGTPGAGPMTTGAHLHFEVLQNGKHLNPLSVLP